jgi:two-component system chemotaxis response regulator CheB
MTPPSLVVMGGSWGGLAAACSLLGELPPGIEVPLLLVLHRSTASDADRLRAVVRHCSGHELREADDKDPLLPRQLLLAPPDYHVLVEPGRVALTTEAPVNSVRPAIDLAFETAAAAYGRGAVAVQLSGTGHDGAAGIVAVRRAGGRVLVQDPATAERSEMPSAAVATGPADLVAAAEDLGRYLADLVHNTVEQGGGAP